MTFLLKNLNYSQSISVQVSSNTSVGEGPRSRVVDGRTGQYHSIAQILYYCEYILQGNWYANLGRFCF